MADVHFSWSDSIQAAFSCLPCFQSSQDPPSDSETQTPRPRDGVFAHAIPPPRARPDELEGLLADASDDADALSLHTNPGDRARRKGKNKKRRRGAPKHIRVFGYDLFGRPPAIQLPESDDEGLLDRRRGPEGIGRTVSGSSMDSDAAPLDAAAIESMSAARQAEAVAREEEERRAKEERRRGGGSARSSSGPRWRVRWICRRVGSRTTSRGSREGPIIACAALAFAPSLTSGTGSGSITSSQDFGPFAKASPSSRSTPTRPKLHATLPMQTQTAQTLAGVVHLAPAQVQVNRRQRHDDDVRHALELKPRDRQQLERVRVYLRDWDWVRTRADNHQFMAHQPYSPSPLSPSSDSVPPSPLSAAGEKEPKKRRKSKRFRGLPGGFSSSELASGVHAEEDAAAAEQRKRSEYLPVTGFPSVGFRGPERRGSDMGVFLARRGDE
ncbi:hypothetical protein C8Q80DRAFT_1345432 [Daedaleopsis nitida]|nr:hypothetical protein C8Q80DRAFT_1345432 [Daedaleopsis nitida]